LREIIKSLWLRMEILNMHPFIFLGPDRGRILLDKCVYVGVICPNYLARFASNGLDFHFYIINNAWWFAYFESFILVIAHTIPSILTSYGQMLSSIYLYYLTCEFPRMLWGKVDYGMTNFFNCGASPHWIGVKFFIHNRFTLQISKVRSSMKICIQIRRWNAVHSYAETCQFKCCRFGQHLETCLRHTVWNQTWLWFTSFQARNIYNAALGGYEHILEEIG